MVMDKARQQITDIERTKVLLSFPPSSGHCYLAHEVALPHSQVGQIRCNNTPTVPTNPPPLYGSPLQLMLSRSSLSSFPFFCPFFLLLFTPCTVPLFGYLFFLLINICIVSSLFQSPKTRVILINSYIVYVHFV